MGCSQACKSFCWGSACIGTTGTSPHNRQEGRSSAQTRPRRGRPAIQTFRNLFSPARTCALLLQDCLALGAIFSATDSVATLQVWGVRMGRQCWVGDQRGHTLKGSAARSVPPETQPPSDSTTRQHLPLFPNSCTCATSTHTACVAHALAQVLDAQAMPLLFSLVFGEGVINDATSVVLLGSVNKLFPSSAPAPPPPPSSPSPRPLSPAPPLGRKTGTPHGPSHGPRGLGGGGGPGTGTGSDHSSGKAADGAGFAMSAAGSGLSMVPGAAGAVVGRILLTFAYLFVTSLALGVLTGLGLAALLRRCGPMAAHHVSEGLV